MSATSEVFKAVNRPQLLVRMHSVSLVTVAVFVVAAAVPFGIVGVAIAVSLSRCLTAAYALRRAWPLAGLDRRDLMQAILGPAIASVAMILIMFAFAAAVSPLAHAQALAILLTIAEAAIGAIVYGIVLLLIDRERRRSARKLVALAQASVLSSLLT